MKMSVEKGQDPKGWYVVGGDHIRLCVLFIPLHYQIILSTGHMHHMGWTIGRTSEGFALYRSDHCMMKGRGFTVLLSPNVLSFSLALSHWIKVHQNCQQIHNEFHTALIFWVNSSIIQPRHQHTTSRLSSTFTLCLLAQMIYTREKGKPSDWNVSLGSDGWCEILEWLYRTCFMVKGPHETGVFKVFWN